MKNEFEDGYVVRVMDLPAGEKGFVTYDDDDFANVYINARLSAEAQTEAGRHELKHVEDDDIHSDAPIDVVEALADRGLPALVKASDLPAPKPKPVSPLTPYQRAVVSSAISALDAIMAETEEDALRRIGRENPIRR